MADKTVFNLPAGALPMVGTDLMVFTRDGATLWKGTFADFRAYILEAVALTGNPTATTQAAIDNSTRIATTAFVQTLIANLIGGAPGALDTLKELADALADDASFAATMTTALAGKQPLAAYLTTLAGLGTHAALKGALAITEADVAGLVADLALKAPLASPALTGAPTAPTVAGTVDATTKIATTAFVQAVAALLAPIASPALTGAPTAPTVAGSADNSTKIATTAFVQAVVAAVINSAPGALDTLKELADAIGDDANFAATMTTALAGKQALAANLTAIAGLASAADKLPYFNGSGAATLADLTAFGRSLIDDADATAGRTTLGVRIGTDVQAYNAILDTLSTLAANKFIARSSAGAAAAKDISDFALSLVDDTTAAAFIATLFGNITAGQIFAGPTTGSAAAPAFRALVADDLRSRLLTSSSVAVSVGNTTALSTLLDYTLPVLGANDYLRLRLRWSVNNNANVKTLQVVLDTTALVGINVTTTLNVEMDVYIYNSNATNVQKALSKYEISTGGVSTPVLLAPAAGAVDTSVAKHLYLKGQKVTAGTDTLTLESYQIEHMRV